MHLWRSSQHGKNSCGLSRRDVLKSTAAAGGLSGLASVATAEDATPSPEEKELLDTYSDAEVVARQVNSREELPRTLYDDDVVPNMETGDPDEMSEPTEGVGESVELEQFGEGMTPRIRVFRELKTGYLSISVYPEKDTANAVLNPTEDGDPLGKESVVTYGSMPEAQGCIAPGECQDCECNLVCCTTDPTSPQCLQYCNQCDCSCICCGCGPTCLNYC